jgi:hypothetical protein
MKRIVQILIIILTANSLSLSAAVGSDKYASNSVLSSGKWFKIGVTTDGVYRIDYSKLVQLGLANPSNPKIFANNQGQLSYYNIDKDPDDLKEISIYTFTGSDGIFNEGDYLLFFGKGTHRWLFNKAKNEYDYLRHNYSDTAFYFITSGANHGKRISTEAIPSQPAGYNSSESDALYSYEVDNENINESGREWYKKISSQSINPGFSDLITTEKIKYRIRVAARASINTLFRFYEGTTVKKTIQLQGINIYDYTGIQFQIADSSGTFTPASASPAFELKYSGPESSTIGGWLDYVRLQARRATSYTGTPMIFSDSRSPAPGRVTSFSVKSSTADVKVWDVSNTEDCMEVPFTFGGNNLTFNTLNDSLKTFIVFSAANATTPFIKPNAVANQNLHASAPAGMIILTHPMFVPYAQKLADIHFAEKGLVSQIVTTDQVYNEFSGGTPDIAALRNFVRMKYIRQLNTSLPLKYLLLFGDGSIDNKTLPPNNPNFIPTWQSQNSNIIVSSYMSDDFYGLLEDNEGEAEGTEDVGIGRLPVSDTVQAGVMINKIRTYMNPASMGEWRNVICITADDEDGNTHMSDAEGLSTVLRDSVPSFNVDKIYLDAFRQVTSVSGQTYPDVNKAINNRINSGCLIFNYLGHGGETGLAHELILKTSDIDSWKNADKLTLFITATCEFSRFDDIEINLTGVKTSKNSAGELVLFSKNGGAIALMSTTRVVYSAPNYFLNKNIYNTAFRLDENGNPLTLGDIIRIAKNNSGSGSNKRNFSLLGDPALSLANPWKGNIVTDSINGISVTSGIDSLKALSLVTVSGHVTGLNGAPESSFNGIISPLVYDKASKVRTLANDGGTTMEFLQRNNVIFSGKTMAKNGKFRFTFIVPRDIDYAFGSGKISYYGSNETKDMNGNFTGFLVGGFTNQPITDKTGPEIRLFMNDTLFRNGGITNSNPKLLAIIEDNGGINATGSGIGHDIAGYLDDDRNNAFVLNSYFQNDFDNFRKGKLTFDLYDLAAGSHTLTLKAWDTYNNSSEETLKFLVESGEKFILKNLMNYPNPFSYDTKFTAEHNRPDYDLDITLNIFSMDGRLIKSINQKVPSSGYSLPPIEWDGNTDGGKRAGRGIFPYTITVITSEGETARHSGRLIIL